MLKAVYGDDNVTGTLATGITVRANSKELEACCWVFDLEMRDGVFRRIVIPNGKVSELGEIAYTDEDAVGYEITVTAMPSADIEGDTHREYTKDKTAEGG